MSQSMLKVPLSELAVIRIVCGQSTCGAALEIPLARLALMPDEVRCPVCGNDIQVIGPLPPNPLRQLGNGIAGLSHLAKGARVEFLVPVKS